MPACSNTAWIMRSIWIMLLVFPAGLDLLSETYMTEKTLLAPGNSCWNILNKSQLTTESKHMQPISKSPCIFIDRFLAMVVTGPGNHVLRKAVDKL